MQLDERSVEVCLYIPRQYFDEAWPRNIGQDADCIGERLIFNANVNHSVQHSIALAISESPSILSAKIRAAATEQSFYFTMLRHIDEDGTLLDEFVQYNLEFDGSIRMAGIHERNSISIHTTAELIDCGYVKAIPYAYVFRISEGRGGDGGWWDIANFLYAHGVDIGLSNARDFLISLIISKSIGRLRGSALDRKARSVAQDWVNRSIQSPHQLRNWIDAKSEWTPEEVNKRLFRHKNSVGSVQLLKALGFTRTARGTYVIGTSKKASRRRRKWLDSERENLMGD